MNKLETLLAWYSTMTPDTVNDARRYYAPDAAFRDPFNDVHGVGAIEAVLRHMFETTTDPRFIIRDRIVQEEQAFVTWLFVFELRGKPYCIEGGSHLRFNAEGLVALHRDYWDAVEELFQKLPVVGSPIRWLRRRLRAPQQA